MSSATETRVLSFTRARVQSHRKAYYFYLSMFTLYSGLADILIKLNFIRFKYVGYLQLDIKEAVQA